MFEKKKKKSLEEIAAAAIRYTIGKKRKVERMK